VTLLWHGRKRAKGNAGLRRATPVATALTLAALFAQVTLSPPGPGELPFARPFDGTKYARPLTADDRLALARFPDPVACLQPGADPATSEGSARMDWDRITAQAEAEVCLFRLLASLPNGMSGFAAFATAQGFTVDENAFIPTNPFVERDGTLRVTASWSLRRNGPRYPTGGLIRILHAIPYGMNVHATYAPDGQRLLHVQIDFSTL
jgi:hypothetical protein